MIAISYHWATHKGFRFPNGGAEFTVACAMALMLYDRQHCGRDMIQSE